MFIKTFPVGAFQCNCTILGDPKTGDAFIVDPGDEGERIAQMVEQLKFKVRYIIHTHAHLDHIGATKSVKQACGGQICLHREDLFLYENIGMQSEMLGMQLDPDVLPVDQHIDNGDVLECHPAFHSKVLHTPGHTPGSVCFLFENLQSEGKSHNLLFAGDTLFAGSIGRTDLWGGDYDQIIASIKERLLTLSGDTIVICGHGPQTSIAREAKANPFLR
jgi:glyoxylase-like metal-dependent hydrolase (beta-lactamase superfamily II)